MTVTAVVGTQWGDEGKGRMIDLLATKADAVIRFQGGGNAGHTIINDLGKFVFNLLPSGVLSSGTKNILGAGLVIDPHAVLSEIDNLSERVPDHGSLHISERAHVVLSIHKRIESLLDNRPGSLKYGSTKRGIAQAYQFKAAKVGLQMADLFQDPVRLKQRLEPIADFANVMFLGLGSDMVTAQDLLDDLRPVIDKIAPYVCNTLPMTHTLVKDKKDVLLEGQLGALRDLDWGIYPYTTSSNPLSGYATVGAGIAAKDINSVIGVTKAYSTCVGAGPFVTELHDSVGDLIREIAGEFGATTGRPRRIGWFDAVATRHGARVQGVTTLCVTLLDVLSCLDEIYVCTDYDVNGGLTKDFPTYQDLEIAKPVLKRFPGWSKPITEARSMQDLPKEARQYIEWIEEAIEAPVSHISVGPKRDQIIYV
jgi:adenylosuccinate synthase